MIPYGRQDVSQADIDAVVDVLRSDYLTQGEVVPRFEAAVASYVGAKHGVAVNSATSALHIACLALELGPGDLLWTSPITFVASANCGLYCGAEVDFVDIDPDSWNISVDSLEARLAEARQAGKLPAVLVVVHLAGVSCDMAEISALCREYGVRIVEDASHAIGGTYRGSKVGCCTFSDIAVFSFHPVKTMTTAEGGMAVTNDAGLADRMKLYRSHGITRAPDRLTRAEGPWYYEQQALGFNYRLSEIHAALGLSQLSRLDEFVARRTSIAEWYRQQFRELPIQLPATWNDRDPGLHLFVIRVKAHRRAIFERLTAAGIGVNVHYIPVHLQPYYQALGFAQGDFPNAEAYYDEAITLPLYPGLTESDLEHIARKLTQSLEEVL